MKKLILLPLLLLCLLSFGQEAKTYDYVSIMQFGKEVRITLNDTEFRVEKFEENVAMFGEFSPTFHWIRKYEEDGWTLYNTMFHSQYNSIVAILRKERVE